MKTTKASMGEAREMPGTDDPCTPSQRAERHVPTELSAAFSYLHLIVPFFLLTGPPRARADVAIQPNVALCSNVALEHLTPICRLESPSI